MDKTRFATEKYARFSMANRTPLRSPTMYRLLDLVETAVNELQVWSPMQLLLAAAVTVILGYLGIVGRVVTRRQV